MPVKVRCPECQKVLTLPDQARGKTARCPDCQGRVPVPGAKKKPATARPKAAAAARKPARAEVTEEELFANMDLSRVEDHKVRVCPKCGVPVDEEDIECPKCGVTIATGRLSAERQRKKERGGPDPDKYYEKFLSTSWEFLKEHYMFGVRTMAYVTISTAVVLAAGFMTIYVAKLPLKVFWGIITLLFALMGPGWCWFLDTTLINWSIDKKVKLDRVRFDFFTCVALGIKFVNWLIVFCAPFLIVFGTIGGLMISNDMLAAGLVVIALGLLPAFFCFPVVMSHMAMPVQWPGWLSPKILPQYFQGLAKPSMYWCMFCFATMLPSMILAAVAVFAFQEDLTTFITDVNHNARVAHVMELEEPKQKSTGAPEETQLEGRIETQLNAVAWWFSATEEQKLAERQYYAAQGGESSGVGEDSKPNWYREVDIDAAAVPGILMLLACVPFGFAAVFNMRANGLLTYYYRPELQLIMEEKQTVWKRKGGDEFDDEGNRLEKADLGPYALKFGGTVMFYVVVNIVLYFATGGEYLLLPRPIAQALNLINSQ